MKKAKKIKCSIYGNGSNEKIESNKDNMDSYIKSIKGCVEEGCFY